MDKSQNSAFTGPQRFQSATDHHAGPAIEKEHSLGEAVHWASDLHVSTGKQVHATSKSGPCLAAAPGRVSRPTYAATLPSLGFLQQSEFRSISFPIHGSLTSFEKITTYPSLAAALSAWRGVATCYSEYTPP
ncbi:hypothetical protein CCUS01_16035 [Colletotrichum cuscutae]|uniref:Uncharacterized protein n=1 Tax=Colletotrichum cuscutae TaxID=1209917 RepID=A0AAI9VFP5_9PEZI|nr:hypothetical protein CCUS01_16035 [Colletotrichum cuscutae]